MNWIFNLVFLKKAHFPLKFLHPKSVTIALLAKARNEAAL